MHIKNLPQLNEEGFPELGRISLGILVKGSNGKKDHPKEADHFVLQRAQDLIPLYGAKPTELLIYLPYPERDRTLRSAYELFKRGGLYCQGDGDAINWMIDPGKSGQVVIKSGHVVTPYKEQDGSEHEIGEVMTCPGAESPEGYQRCADCRLRSLLFVIVRDPAKPWMFAGNRWGYYRISTGSVSNLIDLTKSLNTLVRLTGNRPQGLAGIPMILRRVSRMSAFTTDEGKRAQGEKWYLQIEIDPLWSEYGAMAMAAQALGKPVDSMLSLPEVSGQVSIPDEDLVEGEMEDMQEPEPSPLAEEVEQEISQVVADITALRDNLPGDWGEFHQLAASVIGSAYDSKAFLLAVKERLGLGRTDKMDLDSLTWGVACDILVAKFQPQQ